jgi:hypothetical protein
MNYKQKKKMKTVAIWVAVAAAAVWGLFFYAPGKAMVNGLALKIGWGTAEKPLLN